MGPSLVALGVLFIVLAAGTIMTSFILSLRETIRRGAVPIRHARIRLASFGVVLLGVALVMASVDLPAALWAAIGMFLLALLVFFLATRLRPSPRG